MLPSALPARQCQKLQIPEPPRTDRRVIGIPEPDRFGREIHALPVNAYQACGSVEGLGRYTPSVVQVICSGDVTTEVRNISRECPRSFYVEKDSYITCRAPESVAPGLIGFYEDPSGTGRKSHCYFMKQSKTAEELDRAIKASRLVAADSWIPARQQYFFYFRASLLASRRMATFTQQTLGSWRSETSFFMLV